MPVLSLPRVLSLSALAGVSALTFGLTGPEKFVRLGYGDGGGHPTTVAAGHDADLIKPVNASGHSQPRIGDEGFWLGRADADRPTGMTQTFSVGDQITFGRATGTSHDKDGHTAAGQGSERILEVIDVKALASGLVPAGSPHSPTRLVLVTCRIVGEDGKITRFIVEDERGDAKPAVPVAAVAKAL